MIKGLAQLLNHHRPVSTDLYANCAVFQQCHPDQSIAPGLENRHLPRPVMPKDMAVPTIPFLRLPVAKSNADFTSRFRFQLLNPPHGQTEVAVKPGVDNKLNRPKLPVAVPYRNDNYRLQGEIHPAPNH